MNGVDLEGSTEWLEADGLGGFASGTASGIRTRRYHALLLTATTPPTGRVVLVNGFDAWVETPSGRFALTSQRYAPDVLHPDGAHRIERFDHALWPQWTYRLEDGTRLRHQLFVPHERALVVLSWSLLDGPKSASLVVRPFFSGRDYHALHRENGSFGFDPEERDRRLSFRPYEALPAVIVWTNGHYEHQPDWYRNFLYVEERARGLDFTEDLASPGTLRFELAEGEAICLLAAEGTPLPTHVGPAEHYPSLRATETERRRRFESALDRAGDAYLVRRAAGRTIVAGYPWFTDWGRDTFIAIRGLCIATGRIQDAETILTGWAETVSQGMLPNRFPDRGDGPEYNSVDASLWYVIAVHDFLGVLESGSASGASPKVRQRLEEAVHTILSGYRAGTRYGIHCDEDGLVAAGEPGVQLTWMDARVGGRAVTPRIGKPVEVQALWVNALGFARLLSHEWNTLFQRAITSFRSRFWNAAGGYLYDVIDVDHVHGANDATLRPNQILAVGGLPISLLETERARSVVDSVERHLWTPRGLRTLAPEDPHYVGRYQGGVDERDAAYHQGTAWPWLLGPFVEAWVRVRGQNRDARREARSRFLEPLLHEPGGHLHEIADGDPPHTPRGCPFQAWSVGEASRLDRVVLPSDA